jgi:beta-N-acetylhexosaminidase
MRELWREDIAPYRELRNELPMVMVNHAAYPETPGKNRRRACRLTGLRRCCASASAIAGIIFSDDLEMGGILKFMPIEEAAIAAIRAGMDLLEICHSPELILRAYEALIAEGERSAAFPAAAGARAGKRQQRGEALCGRSSAALTAKQFEALRARILRFGETVEAQTNAEAQTA